MKKHLKLKVKRPVGADRRKGWNKVITRVDTRRGDSRAFEGRFLDDRRTPLGIGTVLVRSIPGIPPSISGTYWSAGIVTSEGVGWIMNLWEDDDFISFRDYVADMLPRASEMDVPGLMAERELLEARREEIDELLSEADPLWSDFPERDMLPTL